MTHRRHPVNIPVVMTLAMVIWGLSWTNAKILGSYDVPSQVLMLWRFFFSSISFIPILIMMRISIRISWKGLIATLFGSFFLTWYNWNYFKGTLHGPAGVGGVLVTTLNPIITFILATIIFRKNVHGKDIAGLILGLSGGALIMNVWTLSPEVIFGKGNVYFLLCAFSWACVTIISSRSATFIKAIPFSFWTILFSTIWMAVLTHRDPVGEIFSFDWIFWVNMIIISTGAMAIATTIFFYGTTKLGSEKSSAFIFTVPVSAMGFSMLFLNEKLTISILTGSIMATVAVYLINKVPAEKKSRT